MSFDMICEAHGIEHRPTKPNHPWPNGQVERMNRTTKGATVESFYNDFMAAYHFGRRLKVELLKYL